MNEIDYIYYNDKSYSEAFKINDFDFPNFYMRL